MRIGLPLRVGGGNGGGLVARRGTEHSLPMATRADSAPVDTADRPLVLVDVQPSACGYQALVCALQEPQRRDAHLLAVTVWSGDPAEPDEGRAEMEQALTALVQRAVQEAGVHGPPRVGVVPQPVTTPDVAARTGAELLVLGSEGAAS